MLEEVARTGLYSLSLRPGLKGIKTSLLDKHYQRKHGREAYYGQKDGGH
jgi:L-ribulose-5-phosphate 4-epimerase